MKSPIVCGIDGSPPSFAAARLARIIAGRLSRPLDLVHVSQADSEAERLADARALQSALGLELRTGVVLRVETGLVRERLIAASRHAALVVLGGRAGRLPWPERSRGAGSAVVALAASPVLVVPSSARRGGAPVLHSGRVVCAVRDADDVAPAATAACWARELGLPLTLATVACPAGLPVHPLGAPPPTGLLYGDRERIWAARAMLAEMRRALAPISPAGCESGVLVGRVVPELARLSASANCALLAVGPARVATRSRRRSTVASLLRRARCPLLVTPSPDAVLALAPPSLTSRAARHTV